MKHGHQTAQNLQIEYEQLTTQELHKRYRYFIANDVHKKNTTYNVRDRMGTILDHGETATDYQDLHDRLEPYLDSALIVMEASTSYYKLYQAFLENGYDVVVANTIKIRSLFPKDDNIDARRLSDMLRLGSVPISFIPGPETQHLRKLVRTRHSLMQEKVRWNNRIQALIDLEGLRMPPFNAFTKTWTRALVTYLERPNASYELKHTFTHYTRVERHLEEISKEMLRYTVEHWREEYEFLQTIPGMGRITGCYVIADVLPIERFAVKKGQKSLRRYVGVVPAFSSSGDSVSQGRIPKGSSRKLLRWALVEAANAITRTKTKLAQFYKMKKKQKKCSGKAKIALAHKLSDIIYHVLTTKKPYVAS